MALFGLMAARSAASRGIRGVAERDGELAEEWPRQVYPLADPGTTKRDKGALTEGGFVAKMGAGWLG
jgi:hypothetical protein